MLTRIRPLRTLVAGPSRRLAFLSTEPLRSEYDATVETGAHSSGAPSTVSRFGAVAAFRKEHQIKLVGIDEKDEDYFPYFYYSKEDVKGTSVAVDGEVTPFYHVLKKVMKKEGYTEPTAIQAQSWPIVMNNRDVISVARTGSGKTVGFLLPALQKLMMENETMQKTSPGGAAGKEKLVPGKRVRVSTRSRAVSPRVLVLAPTRELVSQIEEVAQSYCLQAGLKSTAIYGGAAKGLQIQKLRSGADIVVATPGRCNDLTDMGVLDLSGIRHLVLDEADRMLDMVSVFTFVYVTICIMCIYCTFSVPCM
jgi:superfamily II DNA/RNA helicase